MRVTQSQNVPLSCLSRPLADRLAEAAYRDILGLSYARAFSAAWSTARLWFILSQQCFLLSYSNSRFHCHNTVAILDSLIGPKPYIKEIACDEVVTNKTKGWTGGKTKRR